MKKRFDRRTPGLPWIKRDSYIIPASYKIRYKKRDVKFDDEQAVLFHLTQFGGFRAKGALKWVPSESVERWYVQKRTSGGYSFRASPEFLKEFGDIAIQPLERIWRNGCLNRKDMACCGYNEEETNGAASFLKKLNEFYSSVRVGIKIPNSGISAEDRIQLARLHSIPFLTVKPYAGGRFFHPETSYQRIGSSLRTLLTINGKKSAELDLKASTMQFLNIVLERNEIGSLRGSILANDDPYNYFLSELNSDGNLARDGWIRFDRDGLKNLIYTAIYSSPEDEGANVSNRLRKMGGRVKADDFTGLFPEFFKLLHELKQSTNLPMHMVVNREESRYARVILEEGCLKQEMPILPIHDSFIAISSEVCALEQIMNESSRAMYGMKLKYKRKF